MRILPLLLVLALATAAEAAQRVYQLAIGDPARRDREVPVTLDTIIDTSNGAAIDPDALAERLQRTRLLLLGESHTSAEAHRVQLQVLEALQRRGRRIVIGLEMFPYTEQSSLDVWNNGPWSEREFVEKSRWYEHWGYHWGYYRHLFLFAREHGIALHAVNAPREVVTAVRQKGIGNLAPEHSAHMPPNVDMDDPDHLTFFKASLGNGDALHGGMSDEAWKGMLAAQATWDAAMAWNTVQALKKLDDAAAIAVVLVGSGHVAYGLGIERQARAWLDGGISSLVPMPVADDEGPIGTVRASYANFIWGVAREPWSAWPSLGVSTRAGDGGGRQVIDVEQDGAAAHAGLKVGDVIVAIDGVSIDGRESLSRQMATYGWGDVPRITVQRGTETLTLPLPLRRSP